MISVALGRMGGAPATIGERIIGIERERLREIVNRAIVIPLEKIRRALAVERNGRPRIKRDGLVKIRDGAGDIAFGIIRPAAVAEGGREILTGKATRCDCVAASGDLLIVRDVGLAGAIAVLQGLRQNRRRR